MLVWNNVELAITPQVKMRCFFYWRLSECVADGVTGGKVVPSANDRYETEVRYSAADNN
jgi:hypothetical protein